MVLTTTYYTFSFLNFHDAHTILCLLVAENEEAFDILYCVAFEMMDAQWLAMHASYMEFNVFSPSLCLYLTHTHEKEVVGMMNLVNNNIRGGDC